MVIGDTKEAIRILGLADGDTLTDAKKKYRKLVIDFHPDSYKGSNPSEALERMQELNWAYDVICRLSSTDEFRITIDEAVKNYNSFTYGSVWPGAPINQNAYCNRGDIHHTLFGYEGGEKYCWDPEYEACENFTYSIELGLQDLFRREINPVSISRSGDPPFSHLLTA